MTKRADGFWYVEVAGLWYGFRDAALAWRFRRDVLEVK